VWRLDDDLVRRLHARAGAQRWALSVEAFASFLLASARREFDDELPSTRQLERQLASLHLEDLALACACAEGHEQAWDEFVVRYRPVLYRAADALDRSGRAREVADALYAELFGLRSRDGQRQSHLRYFHGRSSLSTWLRAVLAQRYVDHYRRDARLEALAEEDETIAGAAAATGRALSTRERFLGVLRGVIAAVVAALPPRDRLRLRCYYAQDLTLAQIGRMLGESEATVSRSLAKSRRTIREQVERRLREEEKMSEQEIAEGFAAAIEDSGTLDLDDLLPVAGVAEGLASKRKESRHDRSTTE
jgi:RNA polymerase sigma-70 factor (ECF subfamily)